MRFEITKQYLAYMTVSLPPKQIKPKDIRQAISQNNDQLLKAYLESNPKLFTDLSPNYLKFCCNTNKPQLIQLILQHFPATGPVEKFISDSLVECIGRQKFEYVKIFVEWGFDINQTVWNKREVKMNCLDFAILGGHYEIAYYLYQQANSVTKNLRNPKEYQIIGKKYQYRYVNYSMVVEGLVGNVKNQQMGDYLKKQLTEKRKEQIRRIHQEGCWDWLLRVLGFGRKNNKEVSAKTVKRKERTDQNTETERKISSKNMATSE